MAHCYDTGLHYPLDELWKLDIHAARRELREARRTAHALEHLLERLAPVDRETVVDPQTGETHERWRHRLVCEHVAAGISASVGLPELMVPFRTWQAESRRRRNRKQRIERRAAESVNGDTEAEASPATPSAAPGEPDSHDGVEASGPKP